ncbi:MAG: thioredoxin family protein, partial [Cyclobacteriaceae bacterium]|nr:thioredoxin family protein [Cyclobacteriaceae bacterium]
FDKKRENWLKAIEQDGLEWQHVSDLKYFDSEMIQLYNIVNVPTTILLDPKGEIIAKNIHSQELGAILEQSF